MRSFLVTSRMHPALAARLEISARRGRHEAESRRVARLGIALVIAVVGVLLFLIVGRI